MKKILKRKSIASVFIILVGYLIFGQSLEINSHIKNLPNGKIIFIEGSKLCIKDISSNNKKCFFTFSDSHSSHSLLANDYKFSLKDAVFENGIAIFDNYIIDKNGNDNDKIKVYSYDYDNDKVTVIHEINFVGNDGGRLIKLDDGKIAVLYFSRRMGTAYHCQNLKADIIDLSNSQNIITINILEGREVKDGGGHECQKYLAPNSSSYIDTFSLGGVQLLDREYPVFTNRETIRFMGKISDSQSNGFTRVQSGIVNCNLNKSYACFLEDEFRFDSIKEEIDSYSIDGFKNGVFFDDRTVITTNREIVIDVCGNSYLCLLPEFAYFREKLVLEDMKIIEGTESKEFIYSRDRLALKDVGTMEKSKNNWKEAYLLIKGKKTLDTMNFFRWGNRFAKIGTNFALTEDKKYLTYQKVKQAMNKRNKVYVLDLETGDKEKIYDTNKEAYFLDIIFE